MHACMHAPRMRIAEHQHVCRPIAAGTVVWPVCGLLQPQTVTRTFFSSVLPCTLCAPQGHFVSVFHRKIVDYVQPNEQFDHVE